MDLTNLTTGRIFIFWVPLAAQWMMMALEGPLLAAIIARMAEPKFNLAAYGVALSLALIMESPIIMLISASTTLAKDRQSFLKLRRFSQILNIFVTAGMVLLALPPVFDLVVGRLIGLPDDLAHLVHVSIILMIPWPAAIGYRRLFHGIMIRYDRTRFVAYGTAIRMTLMSLTAIISYFFIDIPGAYVAAAALTIGVVFEAGATRLMAGGIVREILSQPDRGVRSTDLTFRTIYHFYIPLALTTVLALGVRPLITIFLGQSRMAIESLAVLPVVHSLVFILLSFGFSYQEVGIALLGQKFENYGKLKDFAKILFFGTLGVLALIAFTPLAHLWFHTVSGLSLELTRFSIPPLRIMTLLPGLTVLMFFQRSILMSAMRTTALTWSTGIEVLVVLTGLFTCIHVLGLTGITSAAIALLTGSLASNSFLLPRASRALNRVQRAA